MNTIRELKQKGQDLARRVAKFSAPFGNKNAAGPHDMNNASSSKHAHADVLDKYGYVKNEKASAQGPYDVYESTSSTVVNKTVNGVAVVPNSRGEYGRMSRSVAGSRKVFHTIRANQNPAIESLTYSSSLSPNKSIFLDTRKQLEKHLARVHS